MLKRIIPGLGGSGEEDEAKRAAVEEFEKFDSHVHSRVEHEGVLGAKAGMNPIQPGETMQLYVTEKLFSHNLISDTVKAFDSSKCKHTFETIVRKRFEDGTRSKVVSMGKTANVNKRVILYSNEGDVMAVFIQDIHLSKQAYQIYGTKPLFPNQRASELVHQEGKALFCYAVVNAANKKHKELSINMYDGVGYQLDTFNMEEVKLGSGLIRDKVFLVRKLGQPAAVLRQGEFPKDIVAPAWNVSIAPGIDPILIMGLIAVMDAQSI